MEKIKCDNKDCEYWYNNYLLKCSIYSHKEKLINCKDYKPKQENQQELKTEKSCGNDKCVDYGKEYVFNCGLPNIRDNCPDFVEEKQQGLNPNEDNNYFTGNFSYDEILKYLDKQPNTSLHWIVLDIANYLDQRNKGIEKKWTDEDLKELVFYIKCTMAHNSNFLKSFQTETIIDNWKRKL